jgi:hypothetical protein
MHRKMQQQQSEFDAQLQRLQDDMRLAEQQRRVVALAWRWQALFAFSRACGSISPAQVFLWLLTAYSLYVAVTASSLVAAVLWIVAAVTAALVALDSDPATHFDVLYGRMLLFALYSLYSAATASSFFLFAAWYLVALLVAYFTLLNDFFGHRFSSPLKQGLSVFLWMLAAYLVFATASASSYFFANIWHAAACLAIFGALKNDVYDIPVAARELFSIQETAFLYYLTGHFVYFVHAVATASSWLTAFGWFYLAGVCFIPIAAATLGLHEGSEKYFPHPPYLLARVSECVLAALMYRTPLIRRLASRPEKHS